jgi:hypothetical protein
MSSQLKQTVSRTSMPPPLRLHLLSLQKQLQLQRRLLLKLPVSPVSSREELAAIKIQTAFRGYLVMYPSRTFGAYFLFCVDNFFALPVRTKKRYKILLNSAVTISNFHRYVRAWM